MSEDLVSTLKDQGFLTAFYNAILGEIEGPYSDNGVSESLLLEIALEKHLPGIASERDLWLALEPLSRLGVLKKEGETYFLLQYWDSDCCSLVRYPSSTL